MDNYDLKEAYKEIVKALAGLEMATDAIRVARDGYGLKFPGDIERLLIQLKKWLRATQKEVEQGLGLS